MTEKYFSVPFGSGGDLADVPNTAPPDGSVSYTSGWGVDYQLDPNGGPPALNVPRTQSNQIYYDITRALQQVQQTGFPSWISPSANGGTPYSYSAGNQVWGPDGIPYYSLVNGNADMPPSVKWGVIVYASSGFLSGDAIETYSSTLPAGWLWMDGKTIGGAGSGATSRANVDTQALFTVLWNSISNTVLPIQDSAGVATTRGISAAADFAASKRLPLPDKRGRVVAAADNLGGTAANVLNNAAQGGVDGTILGNSGGEADHALSSNENGTHGHAASSLSFAGTAYLQYTGNQGTNIVRSTNSGSGTLYELSLEDSQHNNAQTSDQKGWTVNLSGVTISGSVNTSGLGQAHNTVQPTIIANFRIKL